MRLKWVASLAACLLLVGILFLTVGYRETYRLWKVPVTKQLFYDLQLITGSAESIKAGYDPALENPQDPGRRIFNYPRIWYAFLNLGIGRGAILPLGAASLVLFFLILAVFFRPPDGLTIALLLLITFSSALMLAYERANVDLIFFAGTTLGILALEVSAPLSFAIMLFGILFKIFPVLGAGMFLNTKKDRTALYALGAGLFTLLYIAVRWQEMRHIFSTTEKGGEYSYGMGVAPLYIKDVLGVNAPNLGLYAFLLALILIALAAFIGLRNSGLLAELPLREQRAFWAGAGIYAGTFLLGNNWDYRLMFTLLTVPAMAVWSRQGHGPSRNLARMTTAALLVSCWSMLIRAGLGALPGGLVIGFIVDEAAKWALFFGLTALLAASLPAWLLEKARLLWRRVGLNRMSRRVG